MAAIVAIMKGVKNVFGIISNAVVVTIDIADPIPWIRTWQRLGRLLRMA